MLGTIILATLLAAWPGSRGVFQGGLAADPAGGQLGALRLTTIDGAFHPLEAVAASLAPEKPEPAPEAPPPALFVAAEPETIEDIPSQPPPQPEPAPEPIVAAAAQTGDVLTLDTSGQQPPPPPEPAPEPESASTVAPVDATALRVTAIGDSVMLAAASGLAQAISDIEVDAEIGRPVSVAIDILRARRSAGELGDIVVIHIGNNSPFTSSQFDEMMELLADASRVVFVNLKVPRGWEGSNNAVLAEGVARYPNAALVDWNAACVDHPQFLLDGVHLGPEGAQAYVQLIATPLGVR